MSEQQPNISLAQMFDSRVNYRSQSKEGWWSWLSTCQDKIVLDFGCGDALDRERFETLGAKWIGIDIEGVHVSLRCDGHRLPFRDNSFDVVVANAVFEHLKNPFEAVSEISRVCRPGGLFVGYVAFLEPFHLSYFHHSHLGIEYLLASSGFQVTDVLASRPAIEKLFEDFLFPKRIKYLTSLISSAVRLVLSFLRYLLYVLASLALIFRKETREVRQEKLTLYRTLLEVGFAAGLVFRGVKIGDAVEPRRSETAEALAAQT